MATESSLVDPLLVFDFDGVLVDGMAEYWWSARRAAQQLRPDLALPDALPPAFVQLRPLIHKGWEMVLIAAELASPGFNLQAALADYDGAVAAALQRHGWCPAQLQQALEQVRQQAIAGDRQGWLARHHFYPGVPERLRQLVGEAEGWLVLTTKGTTFARELLAAAGLEPAAVYGHEHGSKPQVLAQLLAERPAVPLWFVEDRRPTLELVRSTPGLESVRCFLVSWGYLAPADGLQLPPGIALLEPATFAAPLTQWPC